MVNDNKSDVITECPTHMVSQPGCYDCVKESEYFRENWREMAKDAGIVFNEKDEDKDKPLQYIKRSKQRDK